MREGEEVVDSGNKYESMKIRKKFKKSKNYRCCFAPTGNPGKYSSKYSCTYPKVYKRRDVTVENMNMCRYTGKYSSKYSCTYPKVYKRRDVTVENMTICRYMEDDI